MSNLCFLVSSCSDKEGDGTTYAEGSGGGTTYPEGPCDGTTYPVGPGVGLTSSMLFQKKQGVLAEGNARWKLTVETLMALTLTAQTAAVSDGLSQPGLGCLAVTRRRAVGLQGLGGRLQGQQGPVWASL